MTDKKKRYIRKNTELYPLISKMKLWPSRKGYLHGIKEVQLKGQYIEAITHCGCFFRIYNSRNSRAARWLRNKWIVTPCKECKVPQWKLDKYSTTFFSQHYGKVLRHDENHYKSNTNQNFGQVEDSK